MRAVFPLLSFAHSKNAENPEDRSAGRLLRIDNKSSSFTENSETLTNMSNMPLMQIFSAENPSVLVRWFLLHDSV